MIDRSIHGKSPPLGKCWDLNKGVGVFTVHLEKSTIGVYFS